MDRDEMTLRSKVRSQYTEERRSRGMVSIYVIKEGYGWSSSELIFSVREELADDLDMDELTDMLVQGYNEL